MTTDVNGNLNITPLSDLIVANVAHDIAANYFESGDFSVFTATELAAKEADLRMKLAPILGALGVDTSADLLRMSFAADHSGLDAVLDVLDVQVDASTKIATIQNIVNSSTVTSAIDTGTLTGTIDPSGAATVASAVQSISARLDQLTALYAKSVPTEAEIEAVGLFDTADFLDDGRDWAAFLGVLTGGLPVGCQFTSLTIDGGLGQPEMTGAFDVVVDGSLVGGDRVVFRQDASGVYRAIGNRRIVAASLTTHANYDGSTIESGYLLDVRDVQNVFGGNGKAVLTGPGGVSATFYQTIELPRFTPSPPQDVPNIYLTDQQIAGISEYNPIYRLDLMFGDTDVPQVSYYLVVPRRPPTSAELGPTSFITPTSYSPDPSTLGSFSGGTITSSWNVPTGMRTGWFFVVFMDDSGHYVWIDGDIAASGTDGAIVVPSSTFAGWSGQKHGYSYVGGSDVFGREFETRLALF